jgi:phosphatidylethanolamine-binding protein (PEBP) family uncharacterized protein
LPTPGSHSYDVQRTRLRGRLESEGVNDRNADEAANRSPETRSVDEGGTPAGAQEWPNDYGDTGYGGPQPPIGDDPHRYVFRLFALDAPPELSPGAPLEDVRAELDRRRLATGTLVGLFAR